MGELVALTIPDRGALTIGRRAYFALGSPRDFSRWKCVGAPPLTGPESKRRAVLESELNEAMAAAQVQLGADVGPVRLDGALADE